MDRELVEMLDKARGVRLSEADLEEHRIAMATANGVLSDDRVTVEAVRATRSVMIAGSTKSK